MANSFFKPFTWKGIEMNTSKAEQTALSAAVLENDRFLRWFGDSKVIDANGEPLVVYHGTGNSFSEFKLTGHVVRQGFYFTSDAQFASGYAEDWADDISYMEGEEAQGASIMPVYLSIKNPVDVRNGWPADVAEKLDDIINYEFLTTLPASDFWLAMDDLVGENVKLTLESFGHDGLIASEVGSPVYVAFRPAQIKSATGNNGDFDGTNPDITK